VDEGQEGWEEEWRVVLVELAHLQQIVVSSDILKG
jgi:hypothetical protein